MLLIVENSIRRINFMVISHKIYSYEQINHEEINILTDQNRTLPDKYTTQDQFFFFAKKFSKIDYFGPVISV